MPRRATWRSLAPLFLLSLFALLGIAVQAGHAATASPATLTLGTTPLVGPGTGDGGIYNFSISGVNAPANGFVAGPKFGHCIEWGIGEANTSNATLRTGANLQLPTGSAAAAPGGAARLQFLLASSEQARTNPALSEAQRDAEAAAHQVAVWILTTEDGDAVVSGEIANPATVTRANQLLAASSTAAAGAAPAIAIVGAEDCGVTTRTIRVSGPAGASATVSIAEGQGTLSGGSASANGQSTNVTLSAAGTADVTLTSTVIGTVRVSAAISTQTMVQVDAGPELQDFAYLEPTTVVTSVTATFTACATPVIVSPPSTTGTTPTTPTTAPATRLRIVKTAIKRARAGTTVEYTIKVTNTTAVAATNVRITDIFPLGTSVVAKPSRASFVNGRLVWTIASLGANASTTVKVKLRIASTVRRARCNVATAVGTNAPQVRAQVCTAIVAGTSFVPRVTG